MLDLWSANHNKIKIKDPKKDVGSIHIFMKTELRKFEDLKNYLDLKNVSYPKTWNVIFKKKSSKNRKARIDELWKDYCIAVYAYYRLFGVYLQIKEEGTVLVKASLHVYNELEKNPKSKYLKKLLTSIIKSEKQSRYPTKFAYYTKIKNGKIFYNRNLDSGMIKTLNSINLKIPKNPKFDTKKQVVKSIVETDNSYWINRKNFKNLPLEDRKNNDIVRKEIIVFNKCVMKIRQKKYSKEFFKKTWHQILVRRSRDERDSVTELFEKMWNLFLIVR